MLDLIRAGGAGEPEGLNVRDWARYVSINPTYTGLTYVAAGVVAAAGIKREQSLLLVEDGMHGIERRDRPRDLVVHGQWRRPWRKTGNWSCLRLQGRI